MESFSTGTGNRYGVTVFHWQVTSSTEKTRDHDSMIIGFRSRPGAVTRVHRLAMLVGAGASLAMIYTVTVIQRPQ